MARTARMEAQLRRVEAALATLLRDVNALGDKCREIERDTISINRRVVNLETATKQLANSKVVV